MRKLSLMLAAITCCVLLAGHVAAQSNKISIRIVPQPNQTTKLNLTYEGDIDLTFEGEVPGSSSPVPPMKMAMKSIIVIVQKNGPADNQGRIAAELTYEDVRFEMAMNGNQLPSREATKTLIGKKFTVIYDKEGGVLDVKVPDDQAAMAESFKQIRQLIYDNMPKGELSIGETMVSPLAMDLPLPLSGAGPLKLQGDVKSKLVAVVNEADDRIARFEETGEAKVASTAEFDSPSGNATMRMDLKLSDNGTSQLNLSKGLLKTYEMKMNMSGRISVSSPAAGPAMQNMTVNGTIKISASSTN